MDAAAFVAAVVAAANDAKDASSLATALTKSNELTSFCSKTDDHSQALAGLDFGRHTAAVVMLLHGEATSRSDVRPEWLVDAATLFSVGEAQQLRELPTKVVEVAERFFQHHFHRDTVAQAIPPLITLIRKLQTSDSQLTGVHATVLRACLMTKFFDVALTLLEPLPIDLTSKTLNILRVLKFYYYAGVVFCGYARHDKASQMFRLVLIAPAESLSKIAIEAFKRRILCNLIVHGKDLPLTKHMSSSMQTALKNSSLAYTELAAAFGKDSVEAFDKAVTKHKTTYLEDSCMGLVKRCRTAYFRHGIRKLTKTYVALPLKELASRSGIASAEDVEKELRHMIDDRQIYAKIDSQSGVVSFLDDPTEFNSEADLVELHQQSTRLAKLLDAVTSLDNELAVDGEYLTKANPELTRSLADDDGMEYED